MWPVCSLLNNHESAKGRGPTCIFWNLHCGLFLSNYRHICYHPHIDMFNLVDNITPDFAKAVKDVPIDAMVRCDPHWLVDKPDLSSHQDGACCLLWQWRWILRWTLWWRWWWWSNTLWYYTCMGSKPLATDLGGWQDCYRHIHINHINELSHGCLRQVRSSKTSLLLFICLESEEFTEGDVICWPMQPGAGLQQSEGVSCSAKVRWLIEMAYRDCETQKVAVGIGPKDGFRMLCHLLAFFWPSNGWVCGSLLFSLVAWAL